MQLYCIIILICFFPLQLLTGINCNQLHAKTVKATIFAFTVFAFTNEAAERPPQSAHHAAAATERARHAAPATERHRATDVATPPRGRPAPRRRDRHETMHGREPSGWTQRKRGGLKSNHPRLCVPNNVHPYYIEQYNGISCADA